MKTKLISVLFAIIIVLNMFSARAYAAEDICFYLECEKIFENMLLVNVCVKGNSGFSGAILCLEYNNNLVSYSHASGSKNLSYMNFTATDEDTGKINMLFDSSKNLSYNGVIASFYFSVLADNANLSFGLFGIGKRAVVDISDGKVTQKSYTTVGKTICFSNSSSSHILGYQKNRDKIRIVGLAYDGFDNIGMYITRVDINLGRVWSEKVYLHAYYALQGTKLTPNELGYDVFFAHIEDIKDSVGCLFITPFYEKDFYIELGYERILTFYKGNIY